LPSCRSKESSPRRSGEEGEELKAKAGQLELGSGQATEEEAVNEASRGSRTAGALDRRSERPQAERE